MDIIQSLIIGAIQGISEFLPISSSGHLVLVPYIFGWDYQGLAFDVALHFGTVLAIIAYFGRDWVVIIANVFPKDHTTPVPSYLRRGNSDSSLHTTGNHPFNSSPKISEVRRGMKSNGAIEQWSSYPKNLLWQLVIASIPAALAGFFIDDYVERTFHSPVLLAFNLVFFGLILWQADKKFPTSLQPSALNLRHSFLVGLAQSLALIPGVSRSGITMTAARSIGLDRNSAARFSFLLGTPAMVGAFVFKLKDLSAIELNLSFWTAVLSATVFGFIAIKYLLQYLKKSNFAVFFWYRLVLAGAVLIIYLTR